jgi:hypothetical protein
VQSTIYTPEIPSATPVITAIDKEIQAHAKTIKSKGRAPLLSPFRNSGLSSPSAIEEGDQDEKTS